MTFNDTSSCRFLSSDSLRELLGVPRVIVNLFDVAYGVRNGQLERELPITARGKVR